MRLVIAYAIIASIPWLASPASCFSPPRSSTTTKSSDGWQKSHGKIINDRGTLSSRTSPLHLSQSANDNLSGFHYDQEPRGTSFISQVSQQDLWERRQMRRPQRRAEMRSARRVSPNSRGGGFAREYSMGDVNGVSGVGVSGGMMNGVAVGNGSVGGGMSMGMGNNQNFETFKENVSINLKSMTELLREMQLSQNIQTNDVKALGMRVADMAERLYGTANNGNGTQNNGGSGNGSSSSSNNKWEDKNFGTSLDGEFHQRIKDVIDEFDMVQQEGAAASNIGGMGYMSSAGEAYYREKIAQLEARINEIDESLQVTEDKFNTQMEYVDMLVNQRLDDIDVGDGAFEFDGMPGPPGPGGPGRGEPFPPPPPPSFQQQQQSMPPPPQRPPMPQEGGPQRENNSNPPPPYNNMDDGRTYYQERNYIDFNEPRNAEIPSNQKQQQTKSVNTRSGGHHYNDKNTSFMSAFSKADNERRREFQPFRDQRRNQVRMGEQLPRGVTNAPNRRGMAVGPPPPPMVDQPGMMMEEYYEEPYFYEEDGGGPMGMMMMEDDYFYDDMMY